MAERVDLVIDPVTREKLPVDLPLTLSPAPEAIRSEVGVPAFVDLSDPLVSKAVALVYWAQQDGDHAPSVAFLGGVAHRLRCPSSNDPTSGLRRSLHDLDIACLHQQLRPAIAFLKALGERGGSALTIFDTPGDRVFNALQGGRRQRFHTLLEPEAGGIGLGIIDLLADEFEFCHRFDLRPDVLAASGNGHTLSPTLLLLAKLQFIQRIPTADAAKVPDRVLEPFGKREVVIGAETKDVRDILAVLADFSFGEDGSSVSMRTIEGMLRSDWGLWKTVSLNLDAIQRSPILRDIRPDLREKILPRLKELREAVQGLTPKRRFGFLQPQWWQQVDSAGPSPTTAYRNEPSPS